MRNDDLNEGLEGMEELLRTAMSEPPPDASVTFEQDVLRRTTPRRLTTTGHIAVGGYALAAVVLCAWLARDLPVVVTAVALIVNAAAAVALRGYVGSLVRAAR